MKKFVLYQMENEFYADCARRIGYKYELGDCFAGALPHVTDYPQKEMGRFDDIEDAKQYCLDSELFSCAYRENGLIKVEEFVIDETDFDDEGEWVAAWGGYVIPYAEDYRIVDTGRERIKFLFSCDLTYSENKNFIDELIDNVEHNYDVEESMDELKNLADSWEVL